MDEVKRTRRARLVAFYLPQYYPIAENNRWWGEGFTEWVLVAQSRPLFRGHEQPKLPGELGFYDLRLEETRVQQAELAREHGIEGFCYWHYWLGGGKRLLQRPFNEVLRTGKPLFPFCLAWANHSWKGVHFGAGGRMLIKQTYEGLADFESHFTVLREAFSDERYITVDGCPVLVIYLPKEIPDCRRMMEYWRELAQKAGFRGLHLIGNGIQPGDRVKYGLDAVTYARHREVENRDLTQKYVRFMYKRLRGALPTLKMYAYREAMKYFIKKEKCPRDEYPSIVTNWDTTARLGTGAVILHGCTPELFRQHAREAMERVAHKEPEQRLVFVKSWNEWSEGNYLEPDRRYGRQFLEALRDEACVTEVE